MLLQSATWSVVGTSKLNGSSACASDSDGPNCASQSHCRRQNRASATRWLLCRSTRATPVRVVWLLCRLCRTDNPHRFRSAAKTQQQPMLSRLRRMLAIPNWHHDSTAFRGVWCRHLSTEGTPARVWEPLRRPARCGASHDHPPQTVAAAMVALSV